MIYRSSAAFFLLLAGTGESVRLVLEDEITGIDFDEAGDVEAQTCGSGAFIVVAKQPSLGMMHVPAATGASFARMAGTDGCSTDYALACENGRSMVRATPTCASAKAEAALSDSTGQWEACSGDSGVVSLVTPIIDSTYLTQMAGGTELSGCVQMIPAANLPELNAVRGSFQSQAAALAARKKELGGCPLVASAEQRKQRGMDFGERARWMNRLRGELGKRGKLMAGGKGNMWENREREHLGQLYNVLVPNDKIALSDPELVLLNCGEPMPLVQGPMLFRHEDVAAATADAASPRSYSTLTVPQTERCFDHSSLLFQSSGSPEHVQTRQLLDEAGFDRLHVEPLPELVSTNNVVSEKQIREATLSLLLNAVWQHEPSKEAKRAILPYLQDGVTCSFGSLLEKMKHRIHRVQKARDAMADLGKHSPMYAKFESLLAMDKYSAAKELHEQSGTAAADQLVRNLGDAMLFAGFLPTVHLASQCVHRQMADPRHVSMYRADRTAYLHEVARLDGISSGFTATMKQNRTLVLEGHSRKLPVGTPVKFVVASANRDPTVFSEPRQFNPQRDDANQQLAWNGKLMDVASRNYAAAPRLCPGYQLSMNVAAKVCDHFTQQL